MARQNGDGGIEWRVKVEDRGGNSGTKTVVLQPTEASSSKMGRVRGLLVAVEKETVEFLENAWSVAKTDPRKVVHCLKLGLALCLVSLIYYLRPLYDGFGGSNAMWAVMTVVVVFEYTVGSTLYKCINRVIGTTLAGCLGIGVHWLATRSGPQLEPVILQASVFLLAMAATFSRFIPSIKARFDYGAMIFILTFSLVSVSGYRIDKLFDLAKERLTTIAIGTSLCITIIMLICPVWAGQELHSLITNNIQKLADSLDECVAEFLENEDHAVTKKALGYKCVLNSKAQEEAMANFARWEPAHGNFAFQHPWQQYLNVGASLRNCACHIDTLNSSISSEVEAPQYLKKHFSTVLQKLGSNTSNVLKEMANVMKTMTKSSTIDLQAEEMNISVLELQNALKSLLLHSPPSPATPTVEASSNDTKETNAILNGIPLKDVVPLIQVASSMTEIAARAGAIMEAVNELASEAEFKPTCFKTTNNSNKSNQYPVKSTSCEDSQDNATIRTLQRV